MSEYWPVLVLSIAAPLLDGAFAYLLWRFLSAGPRARVRGLRITALTGAALTAVNVFYGVPTGFWWPAVASGLITVAALIALWHSRRKRRKVMQLLGAKSRAARDALVRRARESARPSPVLRPSLGGTR